MSGRFVEPEIRQIPEFRADDTARWVELKRKYLAHKIPGIIVRGLPSLSRQAIFDLGGVREHATLETAVAINHDYQPKTGLMQEKDLALHFDTGKLIPNSATTNRVEIGAIEVKLIEGTPSFTDKWGSGYKRYPVVPQEAMEAYNEGFIDTDVFTPVVYVGQAESSDALFSRNRGGLVLAHHITTATPSRLSFIQGVLLVD